jgi:hypothetical protein
MSAERRAANQADGSQSVPCPLLATHHSLLTTHFLDS